MMVANDLIIKKQKKYILIRQSWPLFNFGLIALIKFPFLLKDRESFTFSKKKKFSNYNLI